MQHPSGGRKKGPPAKGLILFRKQKNAKLKQTINVLEAIEGDSDSMTSYVPSSNSDKSDTRSVAEHLVASVPVTESTNSGSRNTSSLDQVVASTSQARK